MGITLGINANHADSSVCIFNKNKLIFAIEEERLNRVKHWAGVPLQSITEGLNFCNIEISQIKNITINTNPLSNLSKKIPYFLKNFLFSKKSKEIIKRQSLKLNLKKVIKNHLGKNLKANFHYVDHHLSHISSAFYPSGFDKAIGLTIDGFGDFCSFAISECSKKEIKIVDRIYFPHSLGVFYEAFTQLIGFKKYGEEYKMMGLSSYGEPKYKDIILNNFFVNKNYKKLNLNLFNHHKREFVYNFSGEPKQNILFNDNIYELLSLDKNNISEREVKNLASSCQKIFELMLHEILEKVKKSKYSRNIVYAGGCALNSLANLKIVSDNYFENLYIPYAPGDAGGSIGSSLHFLSTKYQSFENLDNPYIGNEFTNEDIKNVLSIPEYNKIKFKYLEDYKELNNEIVNKLNDKCVIGIFRGKMEFGPRALGNRSIIASPCFKDMKDIINLKIKKRENFRPFAPSILEDFKNEWFETSFKNYYMSSVEKIQKEKQKLIPAVTHIDGTGRVQCVKSNINIKYYDLIKKFYEKTNVPVILNTSFNENEPIVSSPKEALDCFLRTDMDALVLENYLITR